MFLLLDDYHLNPLYRALVIRKNADDLKDWLDRAERKYALGGARRVANDFFFPSGAIIRTGHLKDDQAYTKYQGHEYQRMLLEELTHIPRELDYEMLLGSCRSTVPGLVAGVFATTNPNGKGHLWVKKRFVKNKEIGIPRPGTIWIPEKTKRPRLFVPARVDDNPTIIEQDPGYIDFLKGLPPNLKAMWLNGSWDVGAGQYFDEWDDKRHVCKPFEIPDNWMRFMCMDYGFTHHTAVYWNAVNPASGKVYTYRELYVQRHTYEMVAQAVARMTPKAERKLISWFVADSSIYDSGKETGRTGYNIMQSELAKMDFKIPIRLATKGKGSRINGWNLIRTYLKIKYTELGKPVTRWRVFNTCENLIRVMPEQLFDESNVEDLDTDGEDDAPDAIRYGFRTLNEPWDESTLPPGKAKRMTSVLTNEELLYKIEVEGKYYKR